MLMSQEKKVIDQLNKQGFVSRNWALENYMSRLGAIICDLKKKGFKFDEEKTKYYPTENGKDFRYYLAKQDKLEVKTSFELNVELKSVLLQMVKYCKGLTTIREINEALENSDMANKIRVIKKYA